VLRRIVDAYGVIGDWADRLAVWMTVVLVTSFTCVVLLQVFMRYVMRGALPWPEEFARFALVWMTFIAASCALRRGYHVGIDFFVAKLPSFRLRAFLKLVAVAAMIFLLCVMITFSWQIAQGAARRTTPGLGISYFWFHAGFLIGSALMLIQSVEHGLRALHALFVPEQASEAEAAAITSSELT
jgi:TRAP-type C4-dicarboxylate transport system permease small subunit